MNQPRFSLALLSSLVLAGMNPVLARQETKPAEPAATAPSASMPTGEELFKKHIAALGGEEALRAEKNRVTKGRVQLKGQSVTGQITTLRVAPNKMYSTVDLPGTVTVETWFDGERGWIRDSNTGVRALSGMELADTKRSADMLGEANYKERYTEVRTVGREKFEGKDVYAVEAVIDPVYRRTLYFDVESGLLSGIRIPAGAAKDVVHVISDYKQFGAVKQPTKVIQRVGSGESTVTFTTIDANVAPMKSVAPPDEIRSVK